MPPTQSTPTNCSNCGSPWYVQAFEQPTNYTVHGKEIQMRKGDLLWTCTHTSPQCVK